VATSLTVAALAAGRTGGTVPEPDVQAMQTRAEDQLRVRGALVSIMYAHALARDVLVLVAALAEAEAERDELEEYAESDPCAYMRDQEFKQRKAADRFRAALEQIAMQYGVGAIGRATGIARAALGEE
jgi:hypothetical protein